MAYRFLVPTSLALFALTACVPATTPSENEADASLSEDIVVDASEVDVCLIIDARNWHAWIDAMPGPDNQSMLRLVGEVDLPTPGYSFEWRVGIADRSATPVQRLVLTATAPDGMVAQVITTESVCYDGPAIAKMYRGILVVCGDRVLADIPDVSIAE